jgi:hypothetical protein
MSLLRPDHRSSKSGGGALLCGFLGAFVIVSGLSAQDVRIDIGPVEKQAQANPITPENPIPRRTFSVAPVYPAEANGIGAGGTVSLVAVVDDTGRVVEIRKAREPLVLAPQGTPTNPTAMRIASEALVRDAAGALRRWTYDPPAKGPIAFTVSFSFKPGAEATSSQSANVTPPLPASAASSSIAGTAGANQPLRVGNQITAPTQDQEGPAGLPCGRACGTCSGHRDSRGHDRRRWTSDGRESAPVGSTARSGCDQCGTAVGVHADAAEWRGQHRSS